MAKQLDQLGGELLARIYFLLVDLLQTLNSFGAILTTDSWFVGYTFFRDRSTPNRVNMYPCFSTP